MTSTELMRAVIVDDEPLARATLRILLAADPEIELAGECEDGCDAVERIAALAPEILFLDIHMPGLDGFEVLQRIGQLTQALVFVTAHNEFALRAFDEQAVDYLLKPFDDARFARTLERAKQRVRQVRAEQVTRNLAGFLRRAAQESTATADADRLVLRDGPRVHVIDVRSIEWIEAQDYCVEIHSGSRTHVVRQTLRELEARLDSRCFFRVHRSALVNLARVQEVALSAQGEPAVLLQNGTRVPLSRSRRAPLLSRLGVAEPSDR